MINKESAEEWRGQSLLDRAAWDQAAACLSELPLLALFLVFHQASFGDSLKFPVRPLAPIVHPQHLRSNAGPRNTVGL